MSSLQVAVATVLVLSVMQLGAQILCYLGLLARRTAYKTMCLCWATCATVCVAVQLWPGVALAAPFAAAAGVLWWRHRNDDDDGPGRRLPQSPLQHPLEGPTPGSSGTADAHSQLGCQS